MSQHLFQLALYWFDLAMGLAYSLCRSKKISLQLTQERSSVPYPGRFVPATAKDQEAEVVTGDADLMDLPGVVYIK
jgi:hypothetical protein